MNTQCYNWEENTIRFTDVNGNKFNLKFKGIKTVISGKSASGKTLLCSMLEPYVWSRNIGMAEYVADNIIIINEKNIKEFFGVKGKLIIIDRADIICTKEIIEQINIDNGINRYLIFSRKAIGLDISPNHFCEMVFKKGEFVLEYDFNVVGW